MKIRNMGSEMIWVTAGQAGSAIGSLFAVHALTRWLTTAEYGQLALALTVCGLFQTIIFAGPGNAALRFYSVAFERHESGPFWAALKKAMLWRVVASLLLCALLSSALATMHQEAWAGFVIATSLFAILQSLAGPIDAIQNATRHRTTVALHQSARQWLQVGCAVGVMALCGATTMAALGGFALSAGLILLSQWRFFRWQFDFSMMPSPDGNVRSWISTLERYSWPFALWGIPYWLQMSSERWSLNMIGNIEDVGRYAVLSQLGYAPVILITSVAVQLVTPVVFGRLGSGNEASRIAHADALLKWLLLTAAALTLLMATGAWILGSWLIGLVTVHSYQSVASLLPLAVLSAGIFATGQVAAIGVLGGESSRLLPPKLTVPCVGIILAFVGAKWGGVKGVVIANLTSSILYCVWVISIKRPVLQKEPAPICV